MTRELRPSILRRLGRHGLSAAGAAGLTLAFFLVLPLMQAIGRDPRPGLELRSADTASVPPPPEPEQPEPEDEPEPEPPELAEQAPLLDLSQLEMALSPGMDGGWMTAGFDFDLDPLAGGAESVDALLSGGDLDTAPRVVYQPSPVLTAKVRKKAPGTVIVKFIVDERGRVVDPRVEASDDPVFDRAALAAVKQWKFEPGKRNGKPVPLPMRVPITFPEG